MPAAHVDADHEGEGIGPGEGSEPRFDLGREAGAVPIASVEDLALVQDNRADQSVRADVLDQLLEFRASHKWKDRGDGVKLERLRGSTACRGCGAADASVDGERIL